MAHGWYFSRKGQLPNSFIGKGKCLLCLKKQTHNNKLAQLLFSYPCRGINWLVNTIEMLVSGLVFKHEFEDQDTLKGGEQQRSLQDQNPPNEGEEETQQ